MLIDFIETKELKREKDKFQYYTFFCEKNNEKEILIEAYRRNKKRGWISKNLSNGNVLIPIFIKNHKIENFLKDELECVENELHISDNIKYTKWEHIGINGLPSGYHFTFFTNYDDDSKITISGDIGTGFLKKYNLPKDMEDSVAIDQFRSSSYEDPRFRYTAIKKVIEYAKSLNKKYVLYDYEYDEEYHISEYDLLPLFDNKFKLYKEIDKSKLYMRSID